MDLGDALPENLTPGYISEENPMFSDDNSYIYFQSRREGYRDIFRMNSDGSGQINLTKSQTEDILPDFYQFNQRISE
jgi:Tol biopolymer transport system component